MFKTRDADLQLDPGFFSDPNIQIQNPAKIMLNPLNPVIFCPLLNLKVFR